MKVKLIIITAATLLVFAGGFMAGKRGQKVITKTQVETKTQIQTQIKTVYVKIADTSAKTHIHRVIKKTTNPNGSTTTTTTEDVDSNQQAQQQSSASGEQSTSSSQTKYVIKYQDRIVKEEVQTLKRPDWIVSAGIGYSLPHLWGDSIGLNGLLEGVVVKAEVDRRIIGPFYLGGWVDTSGTIGLTLSGAF